MLPVFASKDSKLKEHVLDVVRVALSTLQLIDSMFKCAFAVE